MECTRSNHNSQSSDGWSKRTDMYFPEDPFCLHPKLSFCTKKCDPIMFPAASLSLCSKGYQDAVSSCLSRLAGSRLDTLPKPVFLLLEMDFRSRLQTLRLLQIMVSRCIVPSILNKPTSS
jgi:hypothetical protein